MPKITARVPNINWEKGFDRHWNGNAVNTHVFNALSFAFPQGERFFIKTVMEVSQLKGLVLSKELKQNISGFVLQEGMHTKHHEHYNTQLEKQGYENVVYRFIARLERLAEKNFSPVHKLAIVSAYEHYTAVLGDYVLSYPEILKDAPDSMKLIWGWHASEETEHKAVCFDLYITAGGGWLGRVWAFFLVSVEFLAIFLKMYWSMLWRDGCFSFKQLPRTIIQSSRFFFGRHGIGWAVIFKGSKYISPKFHPWQNDNRALLQNWLKDNKDNLTDC